MFVNFPDPIEHAERLLAALVFPGDDDARRRFIEAHRFAFERAMRQLEHLTIMHLAIALDETAGQVERQNRSLAVNVTVTPDDVRRAAQQLREYATKIDSGEAPKPQPKNNEGPQPPSAERDPRRGDAMKLAPVNLRYSYGPDTIHEHVQRLIAEMCDIALDAGVSLWDFRELATAIFLEAALRYNNGNISKTSLTVGVHRNTIPRLTRQAIAVRRKLCPRATRSAQLVKPGWRKGRSAA